MKAVIAGYPNGGGAERLEAAITGPVALARRTRPA
jgi:hypothetical protein